MTRKSERNESSDALPLQPTLEYVQPIHQTIKDFVLEKAKRWPIEFAQGAVPRLIGFLYLLKCATDKSRRLITSHLWSDFLYYARRAELEPVHLSPSEVTHCIQNAFDELLIHEESRDDIRGWCRRHNVFGAIPSFRETIAFDDSPMHMLLAMMIAAGIGSFARDA